MPTVEQKQAAFTGSNGGTGRLRMGASRKATSQHSGLEQQRCCSHVTMR